MDTSLSTSDPLLPKPKTITLCGSTRFPEAHYLAMMHLSLMGHIVIPLGLQGHADQPTGARFITADGNMSDERKQKLDELHYRKIDKSDGIYVVNVGGYVGESTRNEIRYAVEHGKSVWWMFPEAIPDDLRELLMTGYTVSAEPFLRR
jgi:hypothetical protein